MTENLEADPGKILVKMNFPSLYLSEKDLLQIKTNPEEQHVKWMIGYVEAFFGFKMESITDEMIQRHRKVITKDYFMSVFPSHNEIETRIADHIKTAGKCYCLGMIKASIALSGLLVEMLAIFCWQKARAAGILEISEEREKELFGRSFEELDQYKRVDLLKEHLLISDEVKQYFDHIRDRRKSYLHYWTYDETKEDDDALKCYQFAFKIMQYMIQVAISPDASSVITDTGLLDWMREEKKKKSRIQ